ncbi:MAG: UDP-N-acetylglucosamine--N-acetylmuramyl-(pentapeptide) pyrophosphoryl-undecaprenol N-acetylglucosamine transferase [Candidatus Krumholzibacteriia bacterium]
MPRRFLLTGGGTGGHVTPALAAAGALRERYPDAEFRYVGLKDKAEGVMAPRAGYPLSAVTSRGWPPLGPQLIPFAWDLGRGVLMAVAVLLRHRPSLIIATGGYASAPVVLANAALRALRLSRTPLLVHEQNAHLGRMNRLAAGLADLVAVSFAETLAQVPDGRGLYVGYPVRRSCAPGDRRAAREALGIPSRARVVFAFGGSQGARTINRAVVDAARELLADPDLWILHGCGRPFGPHGRSYDGVADVRDRLRTHAPELAEHPRYLRYDFIDDMAACYAASDLVVCRAGAGSLMEVCAQQRAALVIPKANLPGDHQVRNARVIERAGGCRVLYERIDPTAGRGDEPMVAGPVFAAAVADLLAEPARLATMAAAAAQLATTDARRLLAECAAFLLGDGPRPRTAAPVDPTGDRVLGLDAAGMERLLQQVRGGQATALEPGELELLLSKIDGLLTSGHWLQRARGCRIAGLAAYAPAAGLLQQLATGDVPLVRRDAFVGLRLLAPTLGADDHASLLSAIRHGLGDDYFEARAEAAAAVSELAPALDLPARRSLTDAVARLVTDTSFEARMAACEALGRIADAPEPVATALARLHFDPVWKVRGALFDAYARLAERGVLPPHQARRALDGILITANGYLTEYQIRRCRNEAMRRVPQQEV